MSEFRFALIDLETTGLNIKHDKIIEIAVIILTQQGIESCWHTLINPKIRIQSEITQLTGIHNEMVSNAKSFGEISIELKSVLEGCVLVAHNVRFDYGFLKNASMISPFQLY